jgi:hypothetical protein
MDDRLLLLTVLFELLMGIALCSSLLIYLQVAYKQVATTAVPSEYRSNRRG